ncbi:transmembrane protein 198 isoform X3 [Rattus norvegicus]|uniref:transmembrane protein 198 isoform 3 n=1 Tax=Rattus norvegicus TaxID=10116 RepID=UPI002FD7F99A
MPGTMETLRFQLLPPEPDDTFWGAPCQQPLERRLPLLQGCTLPHWVAVWLSGYLPVVLPRAGSGDAAECWGKRGHRTGHWTALRTGSHAVVISRQRRRVQLMRIRQQEERKEKRRKKRPPRAPPRGPRAPPRPGPPDPAYRRRPVPIKRFNGDVLSPSYIQSFRDRQTGSSLSSFMASPTDTDYEYGSRGPLTACSGPPVRV